MRNRFMTLAAGLALAQAPASAQVQDTSWVARSALYEIFVQDFSARGDFRGVIDGLDRIQASGANTLWIMPINPIGQWKKLHAFTLSEVYVWQPRTYFGRVQVVSVLDRHDG